MKVYVLFKTGTIRRHSFDKIAMPNGDKNELSIRIPKKGMGKKRIKYKMDKIQKITIDMGG